MKMKSAYPFRISIFVTVGAAAAALMGSASAATIVASTVTSTTSIINTSGTGGSVVSAANFGEAAVTVNGILHGAGSAAGANLTHNLTFEGDFRNGQTGHGGVLETLFSGIAGANGITMSVSGLTVGREYLYQAYWEGVPGQTLVVTIEGDSISNVADAALGVLISYQFTATDTILNIFMDRDDATGGDPNNWLSGYSLQTTVPEPSAALLGGLGLLALLRRRRS